MWSSFGILRSWFKSTLPISLYLLLISHSIAGHSLSNMKPQGSNPVVIGIGESINRNDSFPQLSSECDAACLHMDSCVPDHHWADAFGEDCASSLTPVLHIIHNYRIASMNRLHSSVFGFLKISEGGPCSISLPSCRKNILSAVSRAKPISWLTTNIVIPC
jgi:hypothetical protein